LELREGLNDDLLGVEVIRDLFVEDVLLELVAADCQQIGVLILQ